MNNEKKEQISISLTLRDEVGVLGELLGGEGGEVPLHAVDVHPPTVGGRGNQGGHLETRINQNFI